MCHRVVPIDNIVGDLGTNVLFLNLVFNLHFLTLCGKSKMTDDCNKMLFILYDGRLYEATNPGATSLGRFSKTVLMGSIIFVKQTKIMLDLNSDNGNVWLTPTVTFCNFRHTQMYVNDTSHVAPAQSVQTTE